VHKIARNFFKDGHFAHCEEYRLVLKILRELGSQAGVTVSWPCVTGFGISSVPKSGLYYELVNMILLV